MILGLLLGVKSANSAKKTQERETGDQSRFLIQVTPGNPYRASEFLGIQRYHNISYINETHALVGGLY